MHSVDSRREYIDESDDLAIVSCSPSLQAQPARADMPSTHAFDYLHQGVVITNSHSRPLWSNRVAHEIIAESGGFHIEACGLSATRMPETATLRRLIAAIGVEGVPTPGVMTGSRRSMRRPLALVIVPTRRALVQRPGAIVFIDDPERALSPPLDLLRQLYGLNLAEASIALKIDTTMEDAMTKGELLAKYRNLTPEDQRTFDRWLTANAVIASIFTLALVAMIINSAGLPGPDTAAAKTANNGNAAASVTRSANGLSAYELMIRLGRELPVRQTADPF
jgi:hypothetical protein